MTKIQPYLSTKRSYREQYAKKANEWTFQTVEAESDLHIIVQKSPNTSKESLMRLAKKEVKKQRGILQAWSTSNPAFFHSLVPVPLPQNIEIPEIICEMSEAARIVGVGPFAAVAGAVAFYVARALHEKSEECLVENGGDTYLFGKKDRIVGLLPDPKTKSHLGLFLEGKDLPCSLCASSATIGHSLSLGKGELAVVRSKNAALADAFATDCCNRLLDARSIEAVIERAKSFEKHGIEGVFLQCQGQIGIWGNMQLVKV